MSGWAQRYAEEAEEREEWERKRQEDSENLWRDRDEVLAVERAKQPVENLLAAGCCPSVTIVDFGLPTQHVVYCERHVVPGFAHAEPHLGLAGVDVPGWRSAPVQWQWSAIP